MIGKPKNREEEKNQRWTQNR